MAQGAHATTAGDTRFGAGGAGGAGGAVGAVGAGAGAGAGAAGAGAKGLQWRSLAPSRPSSTGLLHQSSLRDPETAGCRRRLWRCCKQSENAPCEAQRQHHQKIVTAHILCDGAHDHLCTRRIVSRNFIQSVKQSEGVRHVQSKHRHAFKQDVRHDANENWKAKEGQGAPVTTRTPIGAPHQLTGNQRRHQDNRHCMGANKKDCQKAEMWRVYEHKNEQDDDHCTKLRISCVIVNLRLKHEQHAHEKKKTGVQS